MKLNQLFSQCRFRVCAGIVSSVLLAGVFSASAQTKADTSKEVPAKPAKDPFVKGQKPKVAVAPKKGEEPETFRQIVQVVEFIEAPHADLRKWLKANPGAPDGDALRAEVQKWIEAGSAEVLASQMLMARSGQRAKVESIRGLIYPTQLMPIEWSPSAPSPASFETRNIGMTVEVDPVLEDKVVYLNLAPEWSELVDESQHRPEPKGTVAEGDVRQPMIEVNRVSIQVKSAPGEWMLLDVESVLPKASEQDADTLISDRSVLVFSRASIHTSEALVADADAGDVDEQLGYAMFEWIDVEQASLTRLLQNDDLGQWVGGEKGARAAVENLVEKGDAEVAFTRLFPFRSGQRGKSETIREVIYPTEFEVTEQNTLSNPSAPETQNIGVTVEIDAVFGKSGTVVDLNFAPEIVNLVGHSVSQRYFDLETQAWKPDVMMPIFYTTKLSTQLTLIVDQPLLAGIMMPHDENGQPDKDTRRLLFVTVTK